MDRKAVRSGLSECGDGSSTLCTVCHRRKKRAAMISAVSGNLITGEVIYETANEALAVGWDEEVKIVLEAIYRFEKEMEAKKREGTRIGRRKNHACRRYIRDDRKICIFAGQC